MANERHQYKRLLRSMRAHGANFKSDVESGIFEDSEEQDAKVLESWRHDLPPLEILEKYQRPVSEGLRRYYRAESDLERLQRMRLGEKVPPRITLEVNG